jgi:hypothetical protein
VIGGCIADEVKPSVLGDGVERPFDVALDVGREAEDTARFQAARDPLKVLGVDEAPFPVALLRPRVGIAFFIASRAIAFTALAMPFSNGSTPMKPVPGSALASWRRCSPPPKPISRRNAPVGTSNSD